MLTHLLIDLYAAYQPHQVSRLIIRRHGARAGPQGVHALYMQDYGAPVGFRMALAHSKRVQAAREIVYTS